MNNFFFEAGANAQDAISLIDAVDELLSPLTQDNPGHELTKEEVYDLTRRARMIDSTLRAAREKVDRILKLIAAAE